MLYDRAHDDDFEFLIAREVVEIATHKAETINHRSRIVRRINRRDFVAHLEHRWNDGRPSRADFQGALGAGGEIGANPTPIDQLFPLEIKSSARRAGFAV